jgi:hypothetical protein
LAGILPGQRQSRRLFEAGGVGRAALVADQDGDRTSAVVVDRDAGTEPAGAAAVLAPATRSYDPCETLLDVVLDA